jgi:hypothetical protein
VSVLSADDRADAIAVGAWAIGRGMGDCRMLAQEAGKIPVAYPDPTDTGWRVYARWAEHVIDGLVRAGFTIQHPVHGVDRG